MTFFSSFDKQYPSSRKEISEDKKNAKQKKFLTGMNIFQIRKKKVLEVPKNRITKQKKKSFAAFILPFANHSEC